MQSDEISYIDNTTYGEYAHYETWFEKRQRLEGEREEAERAFFTTIDRKRYQVLSPIPDTSLSDLLRCAWNS